MRPKKKRDVLGVCNLSTRSNLPLTGPVGLYMLLALALRMEELGGAEIYCTQKDLGTCKLFS